MTALLKFIPPAFRRMQSNLVGLGFVSPPNEGSTLTPLGIAYTDRVISDLKRGIEPPTATAWLEDADHHGRDLRRAA